MALSLLLCLPSLAQEDRKAMRDSLKLAMEQLSYHPDSVDLRLRKAAWNMQLGEWQYAKDEYDWVIGHHPDNLAARYYRAYANTQLRRYNFARLDYETVLRVVPGNFDARLGLALLNQKDHHYTEAMDGVMTWAVRELCERIFAQTDILRIYAEPFAYNSGSRRVLEKAGFQKESVLKNNAVKNGKVLDMVMYSLTRGEGRYPVRRLSWEEIPAVIPRSMW